MSDEETRDRLMKLEVITGADARSGLRGEVRDMRDDVTRIYDRLRGMELRLYTIVGGIAVAAWLREYLL